VENDIDAFEGGAHRRYVRYISIKNFNLGRQLLCKGIARQRQHPHIDMAVQEFPAKRPPHDTGATCNQGLHQVSSM
jgi:hypothetical protein